MQKNPFVLKMIKDIRKGRLQTAQVQVHCVGERVGSKSGGDFKF